MGIRVTDQTTVGEVFNSINQALASRHPIIGRYVGMPGASPRSSLYFPHERRGYSMDDIGYHDTRRLANVTGQRLRYGQSVDVTQWLLELEVVDTSGGATGGRGDGGVMNINTALPEVLKTSLICGGLARGLREAARAMEKKEAKLCVLADDCDHAKYIWLMTGLAAKHNINLIKVADKKKLGEWVGLCKIDREGKPRKVVGCSCAVITAYGKDSEAKDKIEQHFEGMETVHPIIK